MANEKRINLFGRVEVVSGTQTTNEFNTVHCRYLLAYLALSADIEHTRESLIGALWPGKLDRSTRNRLSVTLYNLRRMLTTHDQEFEGLICVTKGVIKIDSSSVQIDYQQFSTAIDEARRTSDKAEKRIEYSRALSLYTAPLLVEVNTDWSVIRQFEAAKALHEAAIWIAKDAHRSGDVDRAQLVLHDALKAEPNSERSTELLTNWYTQHGEPEQAIACAKQLRSAMATQGRTLSKAMLDRISELNLMLVDRTRAVVFADEITITVLSLNAKSTRVTERTIEHHGGRKSKSETCWLFRNPVQALEAGRELSIEDPDVSALIHTTIMSENDVPPTISTTAHKVMKQGELLGTDASMHLLKSRGLEPKAVINRNIRLYKYG